MGDGPPPSPAPDGLGDQLKIFNCVPLVQTKPLELAKRSVLVFDPLEPKSMIEPAVRPIDPICSLKLLALSVPPFSTRLDVWANWSATVSITVPRLMVMLPV